MRLAALWTYWFCKHSSMIIMRQVIFAILLATASTGQSTTYSSSMSSYHSCMCISVWEANKLFNSRRISSLYYRSLHVTCQRLGAWLSSCGDHHHGNASLSQVTAVPSPPYNLVRCPQLQTKLLWQVTCKQCKGLYACMLGFYLTFWSMYACTI